MSVQVHFVSFNNQLAHRQVLLTASFPGISTIRTYYRIFTTRAKNNIKKKKKVISWKTVKKFYIKAAGEKI